MALVGVVVRRLLLREPLELKRAAERRPCAGGLGVDVKRTRVAGVIAASLMAAVMVSFVGLINFIGLIAPHIARRLVGDDYRFLLPASLVLGSIIMLASDLTARMVISPIILPIGAITSFLGAPLFLYLLYRGYKR